MTRMAAWRSAAGAALLAALAGCGSAPGLPAPGARGGAVFHLWDPAAGEPVGVLAQGVYPRGLDVSRVELVDLLVRLPVGADGVLAVRAPRADVEPDPAGKSGRVILRTPVLIIGTWKGRPLAGRAEQAVIDRASGTLTLAALDMVLGGTGFLADQAVASISERRLSTFNLSKYRQGLPPPAVAGALAVLPTPLHVPAVRLEPRR